jgi:hypothetical protein
MSHVNRWHSIKCSGPKQPEPRLFFGPAGDLHHNITAQTLENLSKPFRRDVRPCCPAPPPRPEAVSDHALLVRLRLLRLRLRLLVLLLLLLPLLLLLLILLLRRRLARLLWLAL